MSSQEYEQHCADILEGLGWTVQLVGRSGDQGADVIAARDGQRVVLQCKRYSQPVGNAAVQEVFAGMHFQDAGYAAVVSNAPFTKSARQLASKNGVILLHHDSLVEVFGAESDEDSPASPST